MKWSISSFEIKVSLENNCTYIQYVCACRCIGIYGHVLLRAWLPLTVRSWADLAPEERVSLAGMCVREIARDTPH